MKRNILLIILLLSVFFIGPTVAQSKTFTINGRVTSFEESLALEGVTVKIKGTQQVTGTQPDGTFSIDVTDSKQVLVFQLHDYETQEVSVGNQKDVDVVLRRQSIAAKELTRQSHSLTNQDPAGPDKN